MSEKPIRGSILISTASKRPLTVSHLREPESFLTPMKGALLAIIVLVICLLVQA